MYYNVYPLWGKFAELKKHVNIITNASAVNMSLPCWGQKRKQTSHSILRPTKTVFNMKRNNKSLSGKVAEHRAEYWCILCVRLSTTQALENLFCQSFLHMNGIKGTSSPQTCLMHTPTKLHRMWWDTSLCYATKINLTGCNIAFLFFWTCGSEKPPKATIITQCLGNSHAKYFVIGLEHAKHEHSAAAHPGTRLCSLWYSRLQEPWVAPDSSYLKKHLLSGWRSHGSQWLNGPRKCSFFIKALH